MRASKILLLLLPLVLTACLPPKALPSDEVLQRAVLASQKLDSLAFTITMSGSFVGTASSDKLSGRGMLHGVLHDQGKAMEAALSGALQGVMSRSDAVMTLSGRLIAFNQKEMYLKVDALTMKPERPDVPLAYIEPMLGTWWHVQGSQQTGATLSTPDPSFLKAQTEALTVSEDFGLTKVNGHYLYHYGVTLDRKKFASLLQGGADVNQKDLASLEATGEVWIDAETFYLTKAIWNLKNVPTEDGALHATMDVALSDQNKAEPVHVPSTSKQLNPALLAPLLHPDDMIPLVEEPEESNTSSSAQ